MSKVTRLCGLALLIVGLLVAPKTHAELGDHVIELGPGMHEFELGGEDFLVVTTQNLRICFDGITPQRVWGALIPLDGWNLELVKFIWISDNFDLLTLHEGILAGREWRFDSDDVTGHNEKFD